MTLSFLTFSCREIGGGGSPKLSPLPPRSPLHSIMDHLWSECATCVYIYIPWCRHGANPEIPRGPFSSVQPALLVRSSQSSGQSPRADVTSSTSQFPSSSSPLKGEARLSFSCATAISGVMRDSPTPNWPFSLPTPLFLFQPSLLRSVC